MKLATYVAMELRSNGFVHLGNGLTISEENGRRRYLQICLSCSSTTVTNDMSVAEFIRKWG
jgi:hypothetical protein